MVPTLVNEQSSPSAANRLIVGVLLFARFVSSFLPYLASRYVVHLFTRVSQLRQVWRRKAAFPVPMHEHHLLVLGLDLDGGPACADTREMERERERESPNTNKRDKRRYTERLLVQ